MRSSKNMINARWDTMSPVMTTMDNLSYAMRFHRVMVMPIPVIEFIIPINAIFHPIIFFIS